MKRIVKYLLLTALMSLFVCLHTHAQALRTNLPFILTGNPNIGAEFTISRQFTVEGDILWMPYMYKKSQAVFRTLQGNLEFRYYPKPKYYYTNDMWDGFYLGPYALAGNYNIGFNKKDVLWENNRYKGWGVSTGVTLGYKMYLSQRFRLDINLGVGYAHLQYDIYPLGGEYNYKEYRKEVKKTKAWVGPTKFGIHLVYNIFR